MRATQVDVARIAGVSRQTVSLVVNSDKRVAVASRQAILKAIEKTGYRVNTAARKLATASSGVYGLLLPDLSNAFFGVLAQKLREACDRDDIGLFVMTTDSESERGAINRFVDFGVDGLLLVAPRRIESDFSTVVRNTPSVVLTAPTSPEGADLIYADDIGGARLATTELITAGYTNIIHLCTLSDMKSASTKLRKLGYYEAIASTGMTSNSFVIPDEAVETKVSELLKQHGKGLAIVAHNGMTAFRSASAVMRSGLSVGADVGITGFDNTYLAAIPGLALTSIDQNTNRMTAKSVALLKQRISGRKKDTQLVLPTSLVRRASSVRYGV
ncbi:LacI family transcriptional regulator [Mobiluncus mulieris]|uniref:Galactose operon repressor n=1 Tax=Mobiluncus mulieris TaxID=2052 RepID=A0A8G2M703_9ACTO|nr:LacI family DNA-binding transcriptional regulator [Mobiluncus mulieris]MBB5847157.1 LacI family transcriptional regulator [Mobiluncus mulieris]MCU9995849.1 LacI family transcriptional regulator [Mobiluncus mulieris]MCV0011105.1 LacI family transcriptional regulator [Mobiluncus mulieris]NMW60407.1 LacI family transcriptional regulator [Mobiluncus mulieris]PNL42702.1 hypothetical protein CEP82_002120 [Mobiluncus mulieris]